MAVRRPTIPPRSILVATAVVLAACAPDPVTVYRDLPLVRDGLGDTTLLQGDPDLSPGIYVEEEFAPYADGDELGLIDGVQGGRWVHLSVRIGGMRREGQLDIAVRQDGPDGPLVAEITYRLLLTPTGESTLEAYDIPLPIPLTEEEVAALVGRTAHLSVTYTSGDRSATAERTLTFILA